MSLAENIDTEIDQATRAMMPCAAGPANSIAVEKQLWLGLVLARLQRVTTDPGSGDRKFLQSVRGSDPAKLSDAQRQHIMRLAWRYRLQMPSMLRPGADPDKQAPAEAPEHMPRGQHDT